MVSVIRDPRTYSERCHHHPDGPIGSVRYVVQRLVRLVLFDSVLLVANDFCFMYDCMTIEVIVRDRLLRFGESHGEYTCDRADTERRYRTWVQQPFTLAVRALAVTFLSASVA